MKGAFMTKSELVVAV